MKLALMTLLLPCSAWAGSLGGRVVGERGEGLAGVAVYAYDLRLASQVTYTDGDGVFRFEGLAEGPRRLRAFPPTGMNHVPRFYPDGRDLCAGQLLSGDHDGLELVLPEGTPVTGRVVDQGGRPVEGADVTAVGQEALASIWRRGSTDADGYFEVAGLDDLDGEEGTYSLKVSVKGWPTQYLGQVYGEAESQLVAVGSGFAVELGDWSLLDGVGGAGFIEGPDGPVEGASVHFYGGGQVVTVGSEADGYFEAWGVPPGPVLNWASASGLATTYWPGEDRPAAYVEAVEGELVDGLDLYLPDEATFSVRLELPGDPTRASVLLYNDTSTVGRGDVVAEDGTVTLTGLWGGSYALQVYASGAGSFNDWVRDEDGERRWFHLEDGAHNDGGVVTMEPSGSMAGVVTDDLGQPVYGAQVYATHEDTGSVTTVAADRDGAWRLPGMKPGRYHLKASLAHHCHDDPGWVTVYWDDQVYDLRASLVEIGPQDELVGLDFVMPVDNEHDRMGDLWEEYWGLDTTRDDSGEDPDGDGYTNLEEYLLGTNPVEVRPSGGVTCGCGGSGGGAPLVFLPLVLWRRSRASTPARPPRRPLASRAAPCRCG